MPGGYVRLLVWCRNCSHQVSLRKRGDGADTTVLDWQARLVCSNASARSILLPRALDARQLALQPRQ